LICIGFWDSPECVFTRECIDRSQKGVEGTVYINLFKGAVYVVGRESSRSLYNQDLVRYCPLFRVGREAGIPRKTFFDEFSVILTFVCLFV